VGGMSDMEHLKDYCLDVCVIDGLQTYVIDSAKYGVLIKDNELLNYLKKTDKDILSYIELTREIGIDKIYLAFAKFPTLIERLQWFPILCYKNGNQFYHVHYRSTWMCRECKYRMNKPIIMPMVEVDAIIYHYCENKYPDIPSIFQKVKCPKCGKLLQNHLIILE
jgi:ribosomal protein L37AE/L43A